MKTMMKTVIKIISIVLAAALISPGCSSTDGKIKARSDKSVRNSEYREFDTKEVKVSRLRDSISVTGRVIAKQKMPVIAQVQGISEPTDKPFKEGNTFSKGETLVKIKDTEFRNNLKASKGHLVASLVKAMSDIKMDFPDSFAAWDDFLSKIDVEKPLPELPKVKNKQLSNFLAARNIIQQYYSIKAKEDVLSRFRIRAPYKGVVAEYSLDMGTLVTPGKPLGTFIRTDGYEVHAAVSVKDIEHIYEGQKIVFISSDISGNWEGKVIRIGKSVDQKTQAVSVYFQVQGQSLKEGMYLEGAIKASEYQDTYKLPKALLKRNNGVYIIQDSTVKLRAVTPLTFETDYVIVRGLKDGDQIITQEIQHSIEGIKAIAR